MGGVVSRCIGFLILNRVVAPEEVGAISACRRWILGTQYLQCDVISRYVPSLIFRYSLFVILTTFQGVAYLHKATPHVALEEKNDLTQSLKLSPPLGWVYELRTRN